MKTISIHSILLLLICFLTCPIVFGDVSDPVGAMLVPVMGEGRANIICSGGFIQATAYTGMGNIVEQRVLEDSDALWEPDAYANSHYLQLSSGEWVGISSNTETRLHLESSLQPELETSFRIIPFNTLASLFGPDNSAGFTGGSSLAESDILLPWDATWQRYAGYYYFNTFRNRWEDLYNNPAGDTILYPDESLIVIGRVGKDIILRGTVRLGTTSGIIKGNSGTTIIPNPYPFDIPINESGLDAVLAGAATFANADWLLDWDPDSQLYGNFYYFDADDLIWRDLNNNPAESKDTIRAGHGIMVIKNSPDDANWFMEQPFQVK